MTDDDLCYLSAFDAIALFEARKLSPVELLTAHIARSEIAEPVVNAFSETYFDDALEQARKAEARYAKTDGRPRALEGIPVAVKNEAQIKGRRTTYGSLIYKDNIATETDPYIGRLMRAGAIVHVRTTAPEFACDWVCHSRLEGITRNPWNPAYTSGASSGGSGASLAVGTTTLATGSDIVGSIRLPAAHCGVVGCKPPYGRNPNVASQNLDFYSHVGPLTRSVVDCAMMQNVTASPHPHDIASLRGKNHIPLELKGIERWKIAWSMDLGFFEVAPEIRERVLVALDALRDAGAIVEEVDVPWTEEVNRAARHHINHLSCRALVHLKQDHANLMCKNTLFYADRAEETGAEEFLQALETVDEMYRFMGPLMERYHGFVCPTITTGEFPADLWPWDTVSVNRKIVATDYGWNLTHPFNMLSRLPAIAVPAGIAANGLPAGIQIAARNYDDVRVFRIARALERVQPWLDCPERRPRLQ